MNMRNSKIIVCASGYFDPIHKGHIEYLKKAKELGDELIVIVNTDRQAKKKKGYYFMEEEERALIVSSLKFVDSVILSMDEDLSVCKTLGYIKPDIFAKGGDKNEFNIPEKEVCDKNNIKIISKLGEKVQSSSWLLNKIKDNENLNSNSNA